MGPIVIPFAFWSRSVVPLVRMDHKNEAVKKWSKLRSLLRFWHFPRNVLANIGKQILGKMPQHRATGTTLWTKSSNATPNATPNHASLDKSYAVCFAKISGALYHKVHTFGGRHGQPGQTALAQPKSPRTAANGWRFILTRWTASDVMLRKRCPCGA